MNPPFDDSNDSHTSFRDDTQYDTAVIFTAVWV